MSRALWFGLVWFLAALTFAISIGIPGGHGVAAALMFFHLAV
ncbi:hypothetical protein P4S72_07035 [Vibrio sp. PP-XX7]